MPQHLKYKEVEHILLDAGFTPIRQRGSHRMYEGKVNGKRHVVTPAPHKWSDDVGSKTLASIIRQSGLPKDRFGI
ncbi:MAG: type II toxin-antitoxin system HicA family toxin [Nitrososphaerota archaeon]|nr:type II toxin-antitoxin system HicA family toxin [Nitrososphaerota archaeon]